jgi:Spy/CpxP family protein refolding chaperone
MNTKKIILSLVLAVVAASSFAQFPGGGGRRMMMGGPGGGGNPVMLLARDDVRADLALTDDQKNKLKDIQDGMQDKMRTAMTDARAQGLEREQMGKVFEKVFADLSKEINVVLTPEQQKRLKEINIQFNGNRSVSQPEVAKELAITDAQKEKLKGLTDKLREATQALMEKARGGEIQWADLGPITEKNNKALDGEIEKILTAEQKKKLKDMGGKPFVRKDEPAPGI